MPWGIRKAVEIQIAEAFMSLVGRVKIKPQQQRIAYVL